MGKTKVVDRKGFLKRYTELKKSGISFRFGKLAVDFGLTPNQAKGLVGGIQAENNRRAKIKAAEKSKVEKATGAVGQARAEIGLKPLEPVKSEPKPFFTPEKGQWVGVSMSKALDQEPIVVEYVKHDEIDKRVAEINIRRIAILTEEVKNLRNRISDLEHTLGRIAFDQSLI